MHAFAPSYESVLLCVNLPPYEADQYRTSDHDPVIVGLNLGQTINTINGSKIANVLVGTSGKDRITGFGGGGNITGCSGNDDFIC